jgi:hypothetical protein
MSHTVQYTAPRGSGEFLIPLSDFLAYLMEKRQPHEASDRLMAGLQALESECATTNIEKIDFDHWFLIPEYSEEDAKWKSWEQTAKLSQEAAEKRARLNERRKMVDIHTAMLYEFMCYARDGAYTVLCKECSRHLPSTDVSAEEHRVHFDALGFEIGNKLVCNQGHALLIQVELMG